jgi:hypothetical protein
MLFKLNKLAELKSLTQRSFLQSNGSLVPSPLSRQAAFTTTMASSLSYDEMMQLDYGDFSIDHQLKLLMTEAQVQGRPLSEILDEFYKYFRSNFMMHSSLINYVTLATGSANKPVAPKHIARQPASMIAKCVTKNAPSDFSVFTMIMTGWMAHIYKSLGWLLPEYPVAYKMPRTTQYPNLDDLVDAVELKQARRFFESVRAVDFTIVREALAKPSAPGSSLGAGAIAPALIAQYMANATVSASDSLRGRRSSIDVTKAVLSALVKRWDPELAVKAEDSTRLNESSALSEMSRNVILFIAAQELVLENQTFPNYSDTEMIEEVIPAFNEAISTHPVFGKRSITDTVGHMGVTQAFDHQQRPILSVIYEAWRVDSTVAVFDPVRVDKDGDLRFLIPEATLSSRLTDGLSGAMDVMDLESIVSRRIGAFEAMSYENRSGSVHGATSLVLPSLHDAIEGSLLNDEEKLLAIQCKGDVTKDVLEEVGTSRATLFTRVVKAAYRDLYVTLTHYAVSFAESTTIGRSKSIQGDLTDKRKHRALLALAYSHSAPYKAPIGSAAIMAGRIKTSEPLELISYASERKPALTLERKALNFEKSANSLHSWGWHEESQAVSHVTQEYVAEVGNASYQVRMRAQDAFGSGHISTRMRFMKPTLAGAIVSLWFDVFSDITDFFNNLQTDDKTGVTEEAIQARKSSHALQLVAQLRKLGRTVLGQNAQSFVYNSLVASLLDADRIDSVTELQKGVERVRFETWCGFAVITQLGLLNASQRSEIYTFIKENRAIANAVAMESDAGLM